jgi:hypothetical protein
MFQLDAMSAFVNLLAAYNQFNPRKIEPGPDPFTNNSSSSASNRTTGILMIPFGDAVFGIIGLEKFL